MSGSWRRRDGSVNEGNQARFGHEATFDVENRPPESRRLLCAAMNESISYRKYARFSIYNRTDRWV